VVGRSTATPSTTGGILRTMTNPYKTSWSLQSLDTGDDEQQRIVSRRRSGKLRRRRAQYCPTVDYRMDVLYDD
jgi:hypothetical protein